MPRWRIQRCSCTHGQAQSAELTTASFYRSTLSLGSSTVLVRGQLAASPSFAPDGKTIAYLAPATPGGGFQLWTVSAVQSTRPAPAKISSILDLDVTSAPVWIS